MRPAGPARWRAGRCWRGMLARERAVCPVLMQRAVLQAFWGSAVGQACAFLGGFPTFSRPPSQEPGSLTERVRLSLGRPSWAKLGGARAVTG